MSIKLTQLDVRPFAILFYKIKKLKRIALQINHHSLIKNLSENKMYKPEGTNSNSLYKFLF